MVWHVVTHIFTLFHDNSLASYDFPPFFFSFQLREIVESFYEFSFGVTNVKREDDLREKERDVENFI